MQAGLDLGSVKELVVVAPHHKREASQVSYDGSSALLPIQPQEHPFHWKGMGLAVALNGCDRPSQFFPVASIAWGAERAELCGIKTDMSRVIELAHPFPLGFLLSAVFPIRPYAF